MFFLTVKEGREICVKDTRISTTNQNYCQVNITNRCLLLSSSQFSEQNKTYGALVRHTQALAFQTCLSHKGLTHKQESFLQPDEKVFGVGTLLLLKWSYRAAQSTGDICGVKQGKGKRPASGASRL